MFLKHSPASISTDPQFKHKAKFQQIRELVQDIDWVAVLSTTYDSCVIIAPSAQLAAITSDILLGHGIYSKIIPGHFIDAFYLTIRYA